MVPTGVTTWSLALAFLGGFAGGESTGVMLAALSGYLLGYTSPRATWRWAVLALAGWAAGSVVAMLVDHAAAGQYFDAPDDAESALVVLAALAGAYAGAVLHWIASRLVRQD